MKKTFKITNHYLKQVYWLNDEEIKLFKNYLSQLWTSVKFLNKVETKDYIDSIWFQWLLDSYRNREKVVKDTIRKMKIKFYLKLFIWFCVFLWILYILSLETFL